MTTDQIYKLHIAIESIQDTLKHEKISGYKIIAIWLKVAGDYCHEVDSEIAEGKD